MRVNNAIATTALLTAVLAIAACGDASQDSSGVTVPMVGGTLADTAEQEPTANSEAMLDTGTDATCEVTPQQTEGPYYFDIGQLRREITEGKPGVPLVVAIRLVEAGTCEPISGAVVDIWHADAEGRYSGYRGQGDDGADTSGETFLRGRQVTNAAGLVEFETIHPGWYPGRAVHIHFKALADERHLVTSQMYFPNEFNESVSSAEPYSARRSQSPANENDRTFASSRGKDALMAHVTRNGEGYVASLTVVVAY